MINDVEEKPQTFLEALRSIFQPMAVVRLRAGCTAECDSSPGLVQFVDGDGTIYVSWDDGSVTGYRYAENRFEILDERWRLP